MESSEFRASLSQSVTRFYRQHHKRWHWIQLKLRTTGSSSFKSPPADLNKPWPHVYRHIVQYLSLRELSSIDSYAVLMSCFRASRLLRFVHWCPWKNCHLIQCMSRSTSIGILAKGVFVQIFMIRTQASWDAAAIGHGSNFLFVFSLHSCRPPERKIGVGAISGRHS